MISDNLAADIGVNVVTLPLCMSEIWSDGKPLEDEDVRKCVIAFAAICRDRNIAPELASEMITEWSGNKVLTGSMIEKVYNSDMQLTCQELKDCEYIRNFCEKDLCDYNKWRQDFNFVKLENKKKEKIAQKFAEPEIIVPEDDAEKKESLATKLAKLARKNALELWHTPDGAAYITIFINGHKEHKRLHSRSASIKSWISRLGSDFLLETPTTTAINAVLMYLEGVAVYDGPEYEMYVRKAELDDKIFVDIGDPSWKAIEISKGGWQIIDNCPIKFRRPKSLMPLPIPAEGGNIEDLKSVVNADSEDAWIKFTAWLSQAFWCKGPFVHLHVRGPQGSAKSALAETAKKIVDPSRAPRRHLPSSPRDLMMACHNEAIPSFDNVSEFADDIADTICIISTGGSSAARELYTDSDEALIFAKNPIVMNGIADPSQRGDLLDRLMILDLDPIDEDKRISEKEMNQRIEDMRSRILGALLDATVTGLNNVDAVNLASSPRMADFAVWAIACSPVLGWDPEKFMEYYLEARTTDQKELAEGNRLMRGLEALANSGNWSGTSTELLDRLNKDQMIQKGYEPDDWPRKAQQVGTAVRRLVVPAQAMSVCIRFRRSNGKNLIEISKGSVQGTLPGEATPKLHGKNDIGVTSVGSVSFSKEIIEYRKNRENTLEEYKKKTFEKEPTLDTLVPPIAKTEESLENGDTLFQPLVYVLQEVPKFVGIDGRTYGPFRPDEVASLPKIHAMNLISRGMVRRIS